MRTKIPIESASPSACFGSNEEVIDDVVLVRVTLEKAYLVCMTLLPSWSSNLSRILAKFSKVDWLVEVEGASSGDLHAIVTVDMDVIEVNTGTCKGAHELN